jgi:predicted AAA+ superfamily ATPase
MASGAGHPPRVDHDARPSAAPGRRWATRIPLAKPCAREDHRLRRPPFNDRDRARTGRVLLLGSASPALMHHVSDSLAGRLTLVELPPFLLGEVPDIPLERVWLYGGYPDGAVLLHRLPPFQANLKEWLVKRPKYYWRDTGLLHALLGLSEAGPLLAQPWVGASWEGFCIEQILGALAARDRPVEPVPFRSSDRYELDLILAVDGERWAIEIKLTTRPAADDLARLRKAAAMIGADRCCLISQVATPAGNDRELSCSVPHFLQTLAS